jgi:hypothetical protein
VELHHQRLVVTRRLQLEIGGVEFGLGNQACPVVDLQQVFPPGRQAVIAQLPQGAAGMRRGHGASVAQIGLGERHNAPALVSQSDRVK